MVQQITQRHRRIATALDSADQTRQHIVADGGRDHLCKRRQGHDTVFGRHGRRQVRLPFGQQNDIKHIEAGQHDAGEKCTGIQLDHRHTGGSAVDDQHHRRRDQNAQATTGRDGAGGQLHAVTGPQHGRQGQQAHQRDHGTDDAGGGGKNRAGDDGRHSQRARQPRCRQVHAFKELFNQVGALNEVAHEDEQRNGNQHVVGHHRVGALHHQVQRLLDRQRRVGASVSDPCEQHAHAHQGERSGETQHDGHHHQCQHQQAQVAIGHLRHGGQQDKGGQHDRSHDAQAKPDFFSHYFLSLFVTMSASSLAMSSSLTLTICLSFSTSTSSTS